MFVHVFCLCRNMQPGSWKHVFITFFLQRSISSIICQSATKQFKKKIWSYMLWYIRWSSDIFFLQKQEPCDSAGCQNQFELKRASSGSSDIQLLNKIWPKVAWKRQHDCDNLKKLNVNSWIHSILEKLRYRLNILKD